MFKTKIVLSLGICINQIFTVIIIILINIEIKCISISAYQGILLNTPL